MWKIAAVIVKHNDCCPSYVDAFTDCEWPEDANVAGVRFQLEQANSNPWCEEFCKEVKLMQLRAIYAAGRLMIFNSPERITREELQQILIHKES